MALGLSSACVYGVSQGGMVAQWLAIDFPDRVEKLVLCATLARPNRTMQAAVDAWTAMARQGDHRGILLDVARRSYSQKSLRKMLVAYKAIAFFTKPKSLARFCTLAQACAVHDAYARLGDIRCKTLILGGAEDAIATAAASRELAACIPQSRLHLYPGLGHGVYEEARDIPARLRVFFLCQRRRASKSCDSFKPI